jgi:hypothetical protein
VDYARPSATGRAGAELAVFPKIGLAETGGANVGRDWDVAICSGGDVLEQGKQNYFFKK